MEIRHLLRSQANTVLYEIRNNGWQPNEFKWENLESPCYGSNSNILASKLVHQSSYYFIFDNYGGAFFSRWSPDEDKETGEARFDSWLYQLPFFKKWLGYLRREVESPDLWSAITQESEIINATTSDDLNTLFTEDEKKHILSGIDEIKKYLLTAHKLNPELIESRLNYLVEASNRVGRKDWINLLLSVMIGIVVAAALPPEITREIFRFVGSVLSQILHQPLLLP